MADLLNSFDFLILKISRISVIEVYQIGIN